jgi:hypothetical protein
MKLPSLFRTASNVRYDIKPRYYDPVKEEIEQRTARIKKELESDGLLEESEFEFRSNLKGSFAQSRGIKEKLDTKTIASTGLIRTFIFLLLMGSVFGYLYLGPVVFNYFLYIAIFALGIYFLKRLKPSKKDE